MTYQTILTVARHRDADRAHIEAAADLASRLDAHLDVLCLGVDEIQMGYFFTSADAMLMQSTLEQARADAESIRVAVEKMLTGRSLRWTSQSIVSQVGALTEVMASQARYAELVVLPMPYGTARTGEDEAILEAALFAAEVPVLILPESGLPDPFPGPAMIGWNGGNEALRAIRASLPFLRLGGQVEIVVVDPPRRPDDHAQPGLPLSKMLDRQGVETSLVELDANRQPVGGVLMDRAQATGCGLIVAGAYGHSRFREAILGGATRELLKGTPVPILMAH